MRIVLAPDSFKGTITANGVADALAEGWRAADPDAEIRLLPTADGGEGTLDAFATAIDGAVRHAVRVTGPTGAPVDASWLELPDGTAVVELASTSGIELLGDRRLPFDADSTGFGQAIGAALDAGAQRLALGIGSSASTDGGLGLLVALGARVLDADGAPVAGGLRGLTTAASVDLTDLRPLPEGGAVILSDVTNPLLGDRGAAAVFGPQKGLDVDDIPVADAALAAWARLLGTDPQLPGAGAAGGVGYGLRVWGAEFTAGAVAVADLVGMTDAIADADLVITGEGAYDGQSAEGKAPAHIAALAAAAGVPVALVAGHVAADADTSGFVAAVSLTELAGSSSAAIAEPARWLRIAGEQLARR